MTQKRIHIFVICLITLGAALFLFGQDYKPLIGKWSMISETNGGDPVNWTLVLKDSDGKLTALLATDQGEQPAKDFTYASGVLKFKAPYQGNYYDIELKAMPDNKLEGTWSGDGDSGKTTGTKP
ncbi:MAG TPA: hypothetical protein VG168_14415 [Bryobacteraceae bacterium]|jgi:hypothetical protein|nr:hypothetical protein [Bryobacteraceae bacterium]